MGIVTNQAAGRKSPSGNRPSQTLRRDNAPAAAGHHEFESIVFDLVNFGEETIVEVMTAERWATIPPADRPVAVHDRSGRYFITFTMK